MILNILIGLGSLALGIGGLVGLGTFFQHLEKRR